MFLSMPAGSWCRFGAAPGLPDPRLQADLPGTDPRLAFDLAFEGRLSAGRN
jgi:hypothetical protein